MKKRLLCLGLSMLMLVGAVFTGCDQENTNEAAENKNATTVTLAMTKGEGTTDEACQLIEDAVNVITEAKLNTHVEITFYEKDELKDGIISKISQISDLLESGGELAAEGVDEDATDEIIVDEETGRETTLYPEVSDTQYDIVLINGIEQYHEYLNTEIFIDGDVETGILAPISPSILITQYINDKLLSTAQDADLRNAGMGQVYAIPNNRDFGTYTYLILNKAMVDRFGYDPKELAARAVEGSAAGFASSTESILPYLSQVREADPSMKLVAGMPDIETMHYTLGRDVPIGRSQFLLYGNKMTTLLEAAPINAYATSAVKSYYKVLWQLRQWGQPVSSEEVDFSETFAAAYVKGNATTIADVDTDKYYVVVTEAPAKTNDTVYNSMYGVTKYSINAERATEVLELFNTNREFRNLMYYGIKDVHYMVDDKGEYVKLNNDWNADIYDSGNLYLLERSKDLGEYYYAMSANSWKAGKDLNRDAVDGLLLGFSFTSSPALDAAIESLRTKNAAWHKSLVEYSGDNIDLELSNVKTAVDLSDEFKLITDQEAESNSVYIQYRKWYTSVVPSKG